MSALPHKPALVSEIDYLELERASETKHEFIAGEVLAMTGASEAYNLISGSAYVALYNQLRGKRCKIYPADIRVKVEAARLYTYPDISAVCGEARFADNQLDTLLNPTLIIEVLSSTTERYDRGKQFQYYGLLDSLREYALIAQDSPRVERFLRQADNTWVLTDASGLEASITLISIDCTLALADVYERVTFDAEDSGF